MEGDLEIPSISASIVDAINKSPTQLVEVDRSRPASPQPIDHASHQQLHGHASISVEINSAAQSQPMTRNPSNSSNNSAKEDDISGPSPYGTRSRNRSAPRPNYADEPDIEIENVKSAVEATNKRSVSSESATKPGPQQNTGLSSGTTLRLNTSGVSGYQLSNGTNTSDNTASPASVNAQHDRKKRKSTAPDVSAASGGNIPGTSQFFAAPNGISDQPAPKRRKTGDGLGDSGPTPSRRTSLAHPPKHGSRQTALVTFEKSGAILCNGKLEADDGTVYSVEDHVYLICEPPGDPYYLCRIMDFRRANPDDSKSPVVGLLVNWFYRPKDIGRYSTDARFLFASMQSDESPITSLRGKCHIKHRSEFQNLDELRKQRDTFWFNQLYDRYIRRPYEVIPAKSVVNVPENVKKAIHDRWKFLVVEPARQKELTSAIKLCKRCQTYCAPNDSVDCGVCRETWHMACVRPAMTKKPSRGFAWSCGPCSRAQERKLEARHASLILENGIDREDELMEEEEEEVGMVIAARKAVEDAKIDDDLASPRHETAIARLWPWRYLGVHCRVEDVLQYDDQAIYPRASSRLGPRHQANTLLWYGRPVELVKVADNKKKPAKGSNSKKDSKQANAGAIEAERLEKAKRPKWLQDEPQGYVARGEDHDESDPNCTATRLFVMPPDDRSTFAAANSASVPKSQRIDSFMAAARQVGLETNHVTMSKKGDPQISTNFLDKALNMLYKNHFDVNKSEVQLRAESSSKDLKDPELTKEELKKFEDGVMKHGSDLRSVRRLVKSRTTGEIVRFYYTWKFTQRGIEIRNRHEGRRGTKKRAEASWTEIADDEDDSAFDNDKSVAKKRRFHCKFCATRQSRQWRRAPSVPPGLTVLADLKGNSKDKSNQLVVALCQRCAVLWRRYGIKYEDPEEIAKSIQQPGGRAWKRRIDEEMLREVVFANEAAGIPTVPIAAAAAAAIGVPVTVPMEIKKKQTLKSNGEKEGTPASDPLKKKAPVPPPPRVPTPPIEPAEPKMREFPCAVCRWPRLTGNPDELVTCKECKLTVHRRCYSIPDQVVSTKWICDTCINDKDPRYSLDYKCAMCPVHDRQAELVEPPKVTHKKKTDRDREKERLEKELTQHLEQDYLKKQKQKGRPLYPREAVKVTASNNWMHITCAIWMPEIRFASSSRMEGIEGMGAVVATPSRIDPTCKLCKTVDGACVSCHQCHANFHVGCAHEAGYIFGFDVSPVKGSRKDIVQSVNLGNETGSLTSAIWCLEHSVKTIVHDMAETVDESGFNALQLFVQNYKQADLTVTGTARKAALLSQSTKAISQTATVSGNISRRGSLVNGNSKNNGEESPSLVEESNHLKVANGVSASQVRHCVTCNVGTSLSWHAQSSDGHDMIWQCHQCHVRKKLGVPFRPTMDIDAKEPNAEATPQGDFFQLTAPPPPPPPVQYAQAPGYSGGPWPVGQQLLPRQSSALSQQEVIARFTNEIRESTITLSNSKTHASYAFKGIDFGLDYESDPTSAFKYFHHFAFSECRYDETNDVIVSEDGNLVNAPNPFMDGLIRMVMTGQKHAHWRIMPRTTNLTSLPSQTRPVHINHVPGGPARGNMTVNGPPNGVMSGYGPPSQAHVSTYHGPHSSGPPMMSAPHNGMQPVGPNTAHLYAQPPSALPHHVQGPSHMPGPGPMPTQPPYYGPVGTAGPPLMASARGMNYPYGNGPTSMPQSSARPSTPRGTHSAAHSRTGSGSLGMAVNGASSSPNLKNLMH